MRDLASRGREFPLQQPDFLRCRRFPSGAPVSGRSAVGRLGFLFHGIRYNRLPVFTKTG
jgi:hypothetical protein